MNYSSRIAQLLTGVVVVSVVLACSTGTALAAITVVGDFDGTLGGYGDGESDEQRPNEIVVDGDFTVEGEPAEQVEVIIQSTQWTVLDTDSVSVFVEGDSSVEFSQHVSPDEVRLVTDEIPADTTIQVSFSTFYTGGTDAAEIDAGTVTVQYESRGGSAGEESFTATADMAASPENRMEALRNANDGAQQSSLLLPGAIGGTVLLLLVGYLVYRHRQSPAWE